MNLPVTTLIKGRLYEKGTPFSLLSHTPVKGGVRVRIHISGSSLSFNVHKGHWMFDILDRKYLSEIMTNSIAIEGAVEAERTTGEDKRRHIIALEQAITMALRGDKLHTADIFEWHRLLFDSRGFGGMIRTSAAFSQGNGVSYLDPELVRPTFYRLVDYFPYGVSCWQTIAKWHFEFLYCHPFVDGNGRVSRIILNYHTVLCGFNLVCLHVQDRDEYLDCLKYENIEGLATLLERSEIK